MYWVITRIFFQLNSHLDWGLREFQRWSPLIQRLSTLTSAVSIPIRRCTLPENLWTALIFLATALIFLGLRKNLFLLKFHYPAKSGILQSPSCVCLSVCLFVSRISHKLLVGFWRNLVSREVMIIGRRSSKLGVIRIEIRIWDPDNCFSWTTGRIFGSGFQSDPG